MSYETTPLAVRTSQPLYPVKLAVPLRKALSLTPLPSLTPGAEGSLHLLSRKLQSD